MILLRQYNFRLLNVFWGIFAMFIFISCEKEQRTIEKKEKAFQKGKVTQKNVQEIIKKEKKVKKRKRWTQEEKAAKDFLLGYAKGDEHVLNLLAKDTDENKLANSAISELKKYPFPIYDLKTVGYDPDTKLAELQIEMAKISYLSGAVAGEMRWDKLSVVPKEVIQSKLIVKKENNNMQVYANDLVLMMGQSAYYAWWQRESTTPIRLKRFPALQVYVLYAKACGLDDKQMEEKLHNVQLEWVYLGWTDLLKTK